MTPSVPRRECPICGKPIENTEQSAQSFAPFCSRRCKDRDLNQWLSEGYAIPGNPAWDDSEGVPDTENTTESEIGLRPSSYERTRN